MLAVDAQIPLSQEAKEAAAWGEGDAPAGSFPMAGPSEQLPGSARSGDGSPSAH